MPEGMKGKNNTGGVHAGKGWQGYEDKPGPGVNVSFMGQGYGTHMGPNTREYAKPGGYGSSGVASKSSPKSSK